jgi:hypothetical protein
MPMLLFIYRAQEGRNKEFKKYREHNTRKNLRVNTNEDLMHVIFLSSDHFFSHIFSKKLTLKKKSSFSVEIMSLLVLKEDNTEIGDHNSSSDS